MANEVAGNCELRGLTGRESEYVLAHYQARCQQAEAERDAAVSDNAALLQALRDATCQTCTPELAAAQAQEAPEGSTARAWLSSLCADTCGNRKFRPILQADHPGTALLDRLRRLEGLLGEARPRIRWFADIDGNEAARTLLASIDAELKEGGK